MNKQELIKIINEFNSNEIKNKINDEKVLLNYQKVLSICSHIINAGSIILSVISESVQTKIIYAVIVFNILNSILNYELLKSSSSLQNNAKFINDILRENDIKENITVDRFNLSTPINTPKNQEIISI